MKNQLRRALALMAVALLAAVAAPTPAKAAPPTQTQAALRYRVFNTEGRCLDGNNPNAVYLWQCLDVENQYWYIDVFPSGKANFRNAKTQRCLNVGTLGGQAITAPCSTSIYALFYGAATGTNGWVYLQASFPSVSICLNGPSTANGSAVYSNTCYGPDAPVWPTNYWAWTPAPS